LHQRGGRANTGEPRLRAARAQRDLASGLESAQSRTNLQKDFAKTMRRAFNLVELVFVLVIMGILYATAVYSFKPKVLQKEANFVAMKILQAKYLAIQYDSFGLKEQKVGCIEPQKIEYAFKSTIVSNPQKICFDAKGDPHLRSAAEITLEYRSKKATVQVLPKTGYVIIKY
jgi:prepilin-type N-terminal cleavage/methylation domain-containing protein